MRPTRTILVTKLCIDTPVELILIGHCHIKPTPLVQLESPIRKCSPDGRGVCRTFVPHEQHIDIKTQTGGFQSPLIHVPLWRDFTTPQVQDFHQDGRSIIDLIMLFLHEGPYVCDGLMIVHKPNPQHSFVVELCSAESWIARVDVFSINIMMSFDCHN